MPTLLHPHAAAADRAFAAASDPRALKEIEEKWAPLLTDPAFDDLPYKTEMEPSGRITLIPKLDYQRSIYLGRLLSKLHDLRPDGMAFPPLSVVTPSGVFEPDACWISKTRQSSQGMEPISFRGVPELCIELVDASPKSDECQAKTQEYLGGGALEVWLIDRRGHVRFQDRTGETRSSTLFSDFPANFVWDEPPARKVA